MAAVPPNVGNANAQVALDAATHNAADTPKVQAARSSKRLKIAKGMHTSNHITEAELGAHEVFHAQGTAAAAGEWVAPSWFGPAMAAASAPIEARLDNIEARQANSVASDSTDPLHALRDNQGNLPQGFPATLADLVNLTGPELTALLNFYGLANPLCVEDRRQCLKKHIGLWVA